MSLTPPLTQTKSGTVYRWVILFLYSEDTEFPFTCVPLTALEGSNFPFNVCLTVVVAENTGMCNGFFFNQAIQGSMDENIRKQPLQLSCFAGGHRYCIFCKIEEGNT